MGNDYKNRSAGDPEMLAKINFADKAKEANSFIFSKITKKWYTPEEFVWSDETVNYNKGRVNTLHLVITDPRAALQQAIDLAKRNNEYIDYLSEKIWGYYELKKK